VCRIKCAQCRAASSPTSVNRAGLSALSLPAAVSRSLIRLQRCITAFQKPGTFVGGLCGVLVLAVLVSIHNFAHLGILPVSAKPGACAVFCHPHTASNMMLLCLGAR